MPPRIARVVLASSLLVGLAATSSAQQLSEKVRAEIVSNLPKFAPPPADQPTATAKPIGTPAPLSDDPLVRLPDFKVEEKRIPDKDPDMWLSRSARDNKALFEYASSMTELEGALNWWHIPLPFGYSLTPSAQARANKIYTEKKIIREQTRLKTYAEVLAHSDLAEAKILLRSLDLSQHPGK